MSLASDEFFSPLDGWQAGQFLPALLCMNNHSRVMSPMVRRVAFVVHRFLIGLGSIIFVDDCNPHLYPHLVTISIIWINLIRILILPW